jgi:hypothetical protein
MLGLCGLVRCRAVRDHEVKWRFEERRGGRDRGREL